MENKTKYTFQTIVAPEAVRTDFTFLREQLGTKDKVLMQALWNLGIDRLDQLKEEVVSITAALFNDRSTNQQMKAAAKLSQKTPKAEKVATKKAKKAPTAPKVSKIDSSGFFKGFEVVYDASVDEDNA